jgi:hypothetical protein
MIKKDTIIIIFSVVYVGLICSGGIATICGKQALFDFVNVFVWFVCTEFMLINFYEKYLKEKKKN